jgi:release factor glutamine methyltransferase
MPDDAGESPPSRRDWLQRARLRLRDAGIGSPQIVAQLLLGEAVGLPRTGVIAHDDVALGPGARAVADRLLARRLLGEPLHYILGRVEFYGLEFRISPAVLVPRNETEMLVDAALAHPRPADRPMRIVDVGTGSGCIAAAVAHHLPTAELLAIDISPAALAVARDNFARLQVAARVATILGDGPDALNGRVDAGSVDLMLANPPYVDPAEEPDLAPEVRCQPGVALYAGPAGDGGTAAIDAWLTAAFPWLQPGVGAIAFEIGAGQGEAVARAAASAGYVDIGIAPDAAGIPRILSARRPA